MEAEPRPPLFMFTAGPTWSRLTPPSHSQPGSRPRLSKRLGDRGGHSESSIRAEVPVTKQTKKQVPSLQAGEQFQSCGECVVTPQLALVAWQPILGLTSGTELQGGNGGRDLGLGLEVAILASGKSCPVGLGGQVAECGGRDGSGDNCLDTVSRRATPEALLCSQHLLQVLFSGGKKLESIVR